MYLLYEATRLLYDETKNHLEFVKRARDGPTRMTRDTLVIVAKSLQECTVRYAVLQCSV